jgi:CRISPR system Cascade subunit CasD
MQSWGTQSRFTHRDTGLEPSFSGVVGLLCAALGRPRGEPLDDLAGLAMGVRVDREGIMRVDYHTTGGWHLRSEAGYGVPSPDGKKRGTVLSDRYYLADAEFLVGLEGDGALLEEIRAALRKPRWQIYLGRKAFVPSAPVYLPDAAPWEGGLRSAPLEDVLRQYPWLGHLGPPRRSEPRPPERLRLILPDPAGADLRTDVPLSFDERNFAARMVRPATVALSDLEGAPA